MNFIPFSVNKFKKLFGLFQNIDEKIRNDFRSDLLRDVHTIEINFLRREDMELAAQELSSRQLAKIAELTKQIEKRASVLESVYKANIGKFKKFGVREDAYVITTEPIPEKFRTAKSNFPSRKVSPGPAGLLSNRSYILKSPDTYSVGNEILNDQTFRSAQSARDPNRVNKSIRIDKGYQKTKKTQHSPTRSLKTSFINGSSAPSPAHKLTGGHRRILSVNKIHSSPSRQENRMNNFTEEDIPMQLSVSQVQPTAYQELIPPNLEEEINPEDIIEKEIIEDKDREISGLAKHLREAIEEVVRLGEVNIQLKDRLFEFEEQNDENTKLAKNEVEKKLEQARGTQEGQSALQKQLADLKSSLQELNRKNEELQEDADDLERENSRLAAFKEEVHFRHTLEEKEELSGRYYDRKLLQKGLILLRRAVYRSKVVEEMYRNTKELEAYTVQEKVFSYLKRLMIIRRIGKCKQKERNFTLVKDVVSAWRDYIRKEKVIHYLEDKRTSDLLYATFVCWTHYKDIRLNRKSIKNKIAGYASNNLMRKTLQAFKLIFKTYRHDQKVEDQLLDVANNHQRYRIINGCFTRWREFSIRIARPKRLKNEAALAMYNSHLTTYGFNLLKSNQQLYQNIYEQASQLRQYHDNKLAKSVFSVWSNDFKVINIIRKEEKKLQQLFYLRKRFVTWRSEFVQSRRLAALTQVAETHYLQRLAVRIFTNLYNQAVAAKRRKVVFEQLKKKHRSTIVTSAYHTWRNNFINTRKAQKRAVIMNLETKRKCFDAWQEFFRQHIEEKLINARAERQYNKSWSRTLGSIVKVWRQHTIWCKRNVALLEQWKQRKARKVYKIVLAELRINRLRALRERYNAQVKSYETEKARAEKNMIELNEIDKERAEMVDRIEEINRTVEDLKEDIENKERHTERCKEQVKTREELIGRLEIETMDKERDIERLERENKRLTETVHKKAREGETFNNEFVLERARLNDELVKLERDLDKKTKTNETAERENRDIADELQEYVRKSEEIIEALCKELKEAKGQLLIKDQEVREGVELIGEFETRNRGLKEQVEDTLGDIERSSANYAERIKELETHNMMLLEQMRILDRKNEKQIEEIKEVKSTIRKFENEAGVIAEQQHRDTEEFIRNLHRSRIVDDQTSYGLQTEGDDEGKRQADKRKVLEQSPSAVINISTEGPFLSPIKENDHRSTSFISKAQESEIHETAEKVISHNKSLIRAVTIPTFPIKEEEKHEEFSAPSRRDKLLQRSVTATDGILTTAEALRENKRALQEALKKRNQES